jgi:hypothetical protein
MKFVRRDRLPEEPALVQHRLRDAGKTGSLLHGFNSFHNDLKVERCGHSQSLRQNLPNYGLRLDGLGEGLVDLDRI